MRSDNEMLALVHQKAAAIRQRRRRRRWAGASVTGAVLAGLCLAVVIPSPGSDPNQVITVAAPRPTAVPESGTLVLPGDVSRCFPNASAPGQAASPGARRVAGWPDETPAVVVLEPDGAVWVVEGGLVTPWTTRHGDEPGAPGYLWARWAPDGTVLASRLVGTSTVRIDRLRGPGRAEVLVDLPFTVKPDAPAGFCPIDGYLATFAVGRDGLVLLRHRPGPLAHSCPAARDPEQSMDPWRCTFPEVVSPELAPLEKPTERRELGLRIGEMQAVVSDSSDSPAIALSGSGNWVTVYRPGGTPGCCFAGQQAAAAAVSPDGSRLVYSPDGAAVMVGELTTTRGVGERIWQSTDPISALTWTADWFVVGHRGGLTLVSTKDRSVHGLLGFEPRRVVSVDAMEPAEA